MQASAVTHLPSTLAGVELSRPAPSEYPLTPNVGVAPLRLGILDLAETDVYFFDRRLQPAPADVIHPVQVFETGNLLVPADRGCRSRFSCQRLGSTHFRVLTLHSGLTDRFDRQVEIQRGLFERDPGGKRVAVRACPHHTKCLTYN